MGWLGSRCGRAAIIALAAAMTMVCLAIAASSQSATATTTTIRSVSATNASANSFAANWVTSSQLPSSGTVLYGTSPDASSVSQSVREQPVPGALGDVHTATMTGLVSSTTYYFAINVAGTIDNNGGSYYQVKIGPPLPTPTVRTASGKVLKADNTAAVGALVTLTILDPTVLNGSGNTVSAPVSGLTQYDGTWRIALNPRTQDANSYFQYTSSGNTDFLQMIVEGGSLGQFIQHSYPLSFDGSGNMAVSSVNLAQVTPTGTLTATTTPTATNTPLVTVTPTDTATSTPVPGISPTSTPLPLPSPTVPPSPTPVPPVEANPAPSLPQAPPVAPNNPAPVVPATQPTAAPLTLPLGAPPAVLTATPVLPAVATPPTALPTRSTNGATPTPGVNALATAIATSQARLAHWNADQTLTPGALAVLASATPGAPTPVATPAAIATVPITEPFGQLPALLGGSIGLVGLGLALLLVGLVHQLRGSP